MTNALDLLPTAEDVAFYQENGYWISPPILSDAVLDAAERGMHRHYAGDVDRELPTDPDGSFGFQYGTWGWRPEDGDVLRKNDYASLRVGELADLVRQSVIAACAARLAGATEIRLWHDQLLYKPPARGDAANVGWHTDRHYWHACTSENMLTAWVPFHEVTESGGPLMFVPGSHQWSEEAADLSFFDTDLSSLDRYATRHNLRTVTVTLERGQVSFHHCKTVHGSGQNRGAQPRRAIAIHLQPGDNRNSAARHPDGSPVTHANDRLCATLPDGRPDYADPAVCPRLWPPSAA